MWIKEIHIKKKSNLNHSKNNLKVVKKTQLIWLKYNTIYFEWKNLTNIEKEITPTYIGKKNYDQYEHWWKQTLAYIIKKNYDQ